jgi:hypothetical protein
VSDGREPGSLETAVKSRGAEDSDEDTAERGDVVPAVMDCRLCELETAALFVTCCTCSTQ